MDISENEFFRQATLLICRHLDIEISLASLLKYLQHFFLVRALFLNVFEEKMGAIRTIASATDAGGTRLNRLTYLDRQAREYMKSGDVYLKKYGRLKAQIINRPQSHPVSRLMIEDFDTPDTSHMALSLSIDGRLIGNLILESLETGRFSEEDAHWLTLLNEPVAIALANALKHDEITQLKDRLIEDNRNLRHKLAGGSEEIIGLEFGLKQTVKKIDQVAPLDSPVLLLGETGTGKELLAALIHRQSERRNNAWVTINCGAIAGSLIDSELFGHEKGAFTGAVAQKKGHFERADGGTVLLDEVGELPPAAQVRLLRVLQNNEIQRVGGGESIRIDVRIIAATHRDLEDMVKQGLFREDLYFRLNVFPITVPSLRDRANDIPALVQYFLAKKSQRLNIQKIPILAEGALDPLMRYKWPGNVRELENIVERALIIHEGGKLAFGQLIPDPVDDRCQNYDQAAPLVSLNQVIRDHLQRALEASGGRIHGPGGAAERIAVNPNTFRSKMRKLGITK